jgi:hypothetical protein
MSSPSLLSAQESVLSSITSLSSDEYGSLKDDVHSYRELSGVEILRRVQDLRSEGIHYTANDGILNRCGFIFSKDIKGDILTPKGERLLEFILTGVFEIDPRTFFMMSDGKWNCNNPLGTCFQQVKPTCDLLPVLHNDDFSFSLDDFPAILSNLCAIEDVVIHRKRVRHLELLQVTSLLQK